MANVASGSAFHQFLATHAPHSGNPTPVQQPNYNQIAVAPQSSMPPMYVSGGQPMANGQQHPQGTVNPWQARPSASLGMMNRFAATPPGASTPTGSRGQSYGVHAQQPQSYPGQAQPSYPGQTQPPAHPGAPRTPPQAAAQHIPVAVGYDQPMSRASYTAAAQAYSAYANAHQAQQQQMTQHQQQQLPLQAMQRPLRGADYAHISMGDGPNGRGHVMTNSAVGPATDHDKPPQQPMHNYSSNWEQHAHTAERIAPSNGAPNVRATAELLTKLKQILHSRDEYIQQLQNTLTQQQREREEAGILWQQAQKEFAGVPSYAPQATGGASKYMEAPCFYWVPSSDYFSEFEVSGRHTETVTKIRDFEDQGWVIPVSGSLRMQRGGLYRWSILVVKKCQHRPQMQFGVHGLNHEKPWRLVTTSRCSRSRDDDPWQDRPDGDKLIDEGDVIHIVVDMRSTGDTCGTFGFSVNDEPFEKVFDDLPLTNLNTGEAMQLMPVVSMGGDGSSVTLLKS
eukprot:GEMP01020861.1.p1 GENE.GEMP01020861.1~~GEMP01020861.1.p1  ORF type:complete len:508 (-),score=128.82 GEMP01020861.1:1020-2543(-)